MRIQLIYAPTSSNRRNPSWGFPPLGILYLAAYIREHHPDIECKISDGQIIGEEGCLDDFNSFKPDIVGVSFATVHATGAYKLINRMKTIAPDVLVVAGGPHPSALPEDVLSRSKTDLVVAGEGEKPLNEIVENFLKDEDYSFKEKVISSPHVTNIDMLPLPARDLVNLRDYNGSNYTKKKPEDQFLISRGCPYNCTFCSNRVFKIFKPWCRLRSPKNIVDEIQFVKETSGAKEFCDQSDEFNVNLRHAIGICDEIIQRKMDISWKTRITSRVTNFSDEFAEKMAKSGCWSVSVGIESGNQATLDGIRKGITLDGVRKVCHSLKRNGIVVSGNFMLFNVWEENGELRYENVEASRNTIKFADFLMKRKFLDGVSFTITIPFPGSPLFDTCLKFNLIPGEHKGRWKLWDAVWRRIIDLPTVNASDCDELRKEAGKLQAKTLLRNLKYFNMRKFSFLLQNAWEMIKLIR